MKVTTLVELEGPIFGMEEGYISKLIRKRGNGKCFNKLTINRTTSCKSVTFWKKNYVMPCSNKNVSKRTISFLVLFQTYMSSSFSIKTWSSVGETIQKEKIITYMYNISLTVVWNILTKQTKLIFYNKNPQAQNMQM